MVVKIRKPIYLTAISIIAWGLIFTLIYAQAPLFTSNQNQYFLHGLAKAGYGYLGNDWLANTLDPTPVFSWLVEYTYRIFRADVVFYFYYGVLLGIYLFSVFGIADKLFHLRESKTKSSAFLAVFMGIHSATLHFVLNALVKTNDLFEGGVAGQRILGPVFQPSTFGVLLILSIYLFLIGRVYLAVIAAALACIVHPTYLLGAAVLIVVYMWITYLEEKRAGKAISLGLSALILVLPVLVYVYLLYSSAPSDTTIRAREILVHFRIPHHAVISEWWGGNVMVKVAIVVAALFIVRRTKLWVILFVCFSVASLLTLVQLILQSDTLALIFPWRISAFIVPLSTSIIAAYLVSITVDWILDKSVKAEKVIVILSLVVIGFLLLIGITRFSLDLERKQNSKERAMMAFVEDTKKPGEVYLVPVKMQDFRLTTGAPSYIDFKSIPYKDTDVLEWYRRQRLAGKFYRTHDCELLEELAWENGITHVVLPHNDSAQDCPNLLEIYQDTSYGVYVIMHPKRE
jgi:hypothetical protein